jgi:signal transduction histidine kinase
MSDTNAAAHQRTAELLSVVSHDIRAPLGVILGALGELNDPRVGPLTDGQRSLLLLVRRSGERLARLAANVLFLRREAEGVVLVRERVDLREVVRRAVSLFERSGELTKISVSIQTPDERVDVDAEAELLVQAVVNFVANAIRSGRREIVVTVAAHDAGPLVTVDDDGPGFPPELLPVLFEGAAPTSERVPRGLGIGVVRGIAAAHGAVASGKNRHDDQGRAIGARVALQLASPSAADRSS